MMDDDSKTLSYYGVADGGEILVEEIDPIQAAKDADAERRAKDGMQATPSHSQNNSYWTQ
jgi:hypothetical protein